MLDSSEQLAKTRPVFIEKEHFKRILSSFFVLSVLNFGLEKLFWHSGAGR